MTTTKSSNGGSNKISSRLIDYVCFVGVDKSEVSFHDAPFSLYQPQLLKRYPFSDHKVWIFEKISTTKLSRIICTTIIFSVLFLNCIQFQDFVLPQECVSFCQPDGCKVIQMKKGRNKEINSFAFTLTDKDSGNNRT